MKKIVSLIAIVALIASSFLCLSACGGDRDDPSVPNEPSAESIVLGIHNNFPGLDANASTIYDRIYNVCLNYGEVSYVVVEGKPTQTKTISVSKSDKDLSKSKEKEIAKRTAGSVMQSLVSLKA